MWVSTGLNRTLCTLSTPHVNDLQKTKQFCHKTFCPDEFTQDSYLTVWMKEYAAKRATRELCHRIGSDRCSSQISTTSPQVANVFSFQWWSILWNTVWKINRLRSLKPFEKLPVCWSMSSEQTKTERNFGFILQPKQQTFPRIVLMGSGFSFFEWKVVLHCFTVLSSPHWNKQKCSHMIKKMNKNFYCKVLFGHQHDLPDDDGRVTQMG